MMVTQIIIVSDVNSYCVTPSTTLKWPMATVMNECGWMNGWFDSIKFYYIFPGCATYQLSIFLTLVQF